MAYIHQLPSGSWRAIVKHHGRAKSVTARTKGECQRRAAETLIMMGGSDAIAEKAGVTVGGMLDAALAEGRRRWSPTYYDDVARVIDALPAEFSSRSVPDVTPAIVWALYRQLEIDGWSPHRIRRLHNALAKAWTDAIPLGWATMNPARGARTPQLPHRHIDPPSSNTVDDILAAADGTLGTFLRLAVATGARRGELVALQWADIDLERGRCRIRRSLVYSPSTGIGERDTKTSVKGHRTIRLGPGLVARLAELRKIQIEKADGAVVSVWVFSHDAGASPWRPDYVSRAFRLACQSIGVTGVRLHDLRHHLATQLLTEGESPHTVAARLGHSSTATTLRTYSHWIEEDEAISNRLDDRYG